MGSTLRHSLITLERQITKIHSAEQQSADVDSSTTDKLNKPLSPHADNTGHSSLGIVLQTSLSKTQCFLEMIYGYTGEFSVWSEDYGLQRSPLQVRAVIIKRRQPVSAVVGIGLSFTSWQLHRVVTAVKTKQDGGTVDISSERMDGHLKPICNVSSLGCQTDYATVTINISRKTVLDRGPRSDQLRYYAYTRWTLTLTYDLDFQSKMSYGHDPHIQHFKFKGQSVQTIEWKQTEVQTDATVR